MSPPITDAERVLAHPTYDPRPAAGPIPAAGVFAEPLRCLAVNAEWAAHLLGVIARLDELDAWIGTDEEVEAARQQVREIMLLLATPCEV